MNLHGSKKNIHTKNGKKSILHGLNDFWIYSFGNKKIIFGVVGADLAIRVLMQQWIIRWVAAEHQAQQESYIEIHLNYPNNSANSRNINNNEARKLKFCMKRPKCFEHFKIMLRTCVDRSSLTDTLPGGASVVAPVDTLSYKLNI